MKSLVAWLVLSLQAVVIHASSEDSGDRQNEPENNNNSPNNQLGPRTLAFRYIPPVADRRNEGPVEVETLLNFNNFAGPKEPKPLSKSELKELFENIRNKPGVLNEMIRGWRHSFYLMRENRELIEMVEEGFQLPKALYAAIPLERMAPRIWESIPPIMFLNILKARLDRNLIAKLSEMLSLYRSFPPGVFQHRDNFILRILYYPVIREAWDPVIFKMNVEYRNYESLASFILWHMACQQYLPEASTMPEKRHIILAERKKALEFLMKRKDELVAQGDDEKKLNLIRHLLRLYQFNFLGPVLIGSYKETPGVIETFFASKLPLKSIKPDAILMFFKIKDREYATMNVTDRILFRICFYARLGSNVIKPVSKTDQHYFAAQVEAKEISTIEARYICVIGIYNRTFSLLHRFVAKVGHPVEQSLKNWMKTNPRIRLMLITNADNDVERLRLMKWSTSQGNRFVMKDEVRFFIQSPQTEDNNQPTKVAKTIESRASRLTENQIEMETSAKRPIPDLFSDFKCEVPAIDSVYLHSRFEYFLENLGNGKYEPKRSFPGFDEEKEAALLTFAAKMMTVVIGHFRQHPNTYAELTFMDQSAVGQGLLFEALDNLAKILLLPEARVFTVNMKGTGMIPLPMLSPAFMTELGAFHGLMLSLRRRIPLPLDTLYHQFLFYEESMSVSKISRNLYEKYLKQQAACFGVECRDYLGEMYPMIVKEHVPFEIRSEGKLSKALNNFVLDRPDEYCDPKSSEVIINVNRTDHDQFTRGYRAFFFKALTESLLLGRFEYQRHLRMFFLDKVQEQLNSALTMRMWSIDSKINVEELIERGIIYGAGSKDVMVANAEGSVLTGDAAFAKLLKSLDLNDLRYLLWFITGSFVEPAGGFASTPITVNIEADPQRISTAQTCFRQLNWRVKDGSFERSAESLMEAVKSAGGYFKEE